MKQERIDASQMELLEKVVSIKRVTKVVKFRKQSAKEKKTR